MSSIRPWRTIAVLSGRIINRTVSGWARTTLVILSMLSMWTCVAAECHAQSYRGGFVWEDSPSSIMMNISIGMSDFAPDRLVCLAKQLRQRYSDRKKVLIFIFSTDVAAKRYDKPLTGDSTQTRPNWAAQNHAIYSLDADKGEEYLEIQPLGTGPSAVSSSDVHTRIKLPVTSPPACNLEVADRCLLALNAVNYPWDALKANISGTVTLEGVIARDGVVKQVRIVSREVHPSDSPARLVNAAVQNLKTWRFEAASHPDSIRITYAYLIESSGVPGHVSVQFELPREVEIRGAQSQ
jgi:TonB family protein